MRGWGSSFVLAVVGALLLWGGIMHFESAYLPETATVEGPVARVAPADGRMALLFEGRDERFVLAGSPLPHPTAAALRDALSVSVVYDTRDYGHGTRAIVGLAVDGHAYFSPLTYQIVSAMIALVLLVPGAMMFAIGAGALTRTRTVVEAFEEPAPVERQALIIPFPRRPALTDV